MLVVGILGEETSILLRLNNGGIDGGNLLDRDSAACDQHVLGEYISPKSNQFLWNRNDKRKREKGNPQTPHRHSLNPS